MPIFLQENWKYVGGALFIHLLLAALVIGMAFGSRQAVVPQLAIHAVMVDRATLNRMARQAQPKPPAEDPVRKQQEEAAKQRELERQQQEQAKQQETERQEQLKQEKLKEQQRQDQLRLDADAKQRTFQEQQRAQAVQKQQELQRQAGEQEAKRQQQQAAEQKRIAEIQQKQREAEQKRQAEADAKAQTTRESELRQQLEQEEGRNQAVDAGLLNQYVALLNQRVERNWTKPPSAKQGLECEVKVTQATGGTVLSVTVGRCNGDAAVRQSIEAAVLRSSPLPAPPDPRLFDRNLTFVFKPVE